MSTERRYTEDEIAALFKQAAEAQEDAQRHLPHSEGLTLTELQEIGKEAGLTPAFIARAAATFDQPTLARTPERLLGLPVGVGRVVDLPGPFSDEDWERLVADLRMTFHATGKVRQDGSLRQWRNGNLHALIEPTDAGHRLHLRTRKGSASSGLMSGLVALVTGLIMLLSMVLSGDALWVDDAFIGAVILAVGLGLTGGTAVQLSRWSREREQQMEAVAGRAVQRAVARQAAPLREPDASPALDLDAFPEPEPAARPHRSGRTRT